MTSTTSQPSVPNHHADHPGFCGVTGLLAGLSMLIGRGALSRLAIGLTGAGPADRVVDIGCGPGSAVRAAARRGATAHGLDPAPVMRNLASRLTWRRPRVAWLDGVAEDLPLPNGSVTVVWSIATVHHWSDIGQGVNEVLRVLEPGGRFLALERRTRPGARGLASHGWTDGQANMFAECCRAAGLVDVRVEAHRARLSRHLAVLAAHP